MIILLQLSTPNRGNNKYICLLRITIIDAIIHFSYYEMSNSPFLDFEGTFSKWCYIFDVMFCCVHMSWISAGESCFGFYNWYETGQSKNFGIWSMCC